MSQSPVRVLRRSCRRRGHLWKTGSDPANGRYCARCGIWEDRGEEGAHDPE